MILSFGNGLFRPITLTLTLLFLYFDLPLLASGKTEDEHPPLPL